MAASNRASVTAARTFASVVAERHGLHPPVDVLGLLAKLADVQHDDIPGTCDAILIAREPRPVVILAESRRGHRRERFSAAHEIGHILMPWQHGTIVCHTEPGFMFSEPIVSAIESDANQFAGELLIPGPWLAARLSDSSRAAEALCVAAEEADVSLHVAVLAAARRLDGPGFIVATDEDAVVELVAGIHAESHLRSRTPARGEVFVPDRHRSGSATLSTYDAGRRTLWVVQHLAEAEILQPPVESSRSILDSMLADLDAGVALESRRSVSGIIGAVNGHAEGRNAPSANALLAVLRPRFAGRSELEPVTKHPRFDEFLQARALELFLKRQR